MTAEEWVDVRIRTSVDAGELLGLLDDSSVQGSWEDNGTLHLYWPRQGWSRELLGRLQHVLAVLDPGGLSEQAIQVEPVALQDWNRRWAESVRPIRVGRRIVIRPSWESVTLGERDIEIVLDPKQAFGTGHHATTALLLEQLETLIRGGETVLDVGTGSGLLAMAALRLGAARALGIDNDPVAIECAQEYARINRFGGELTLQCGTVTGGQTFDLVLANLDHQTLLQLRDILAACTARRLLVSGVLADQQREIVESFAHAGLYANRQWERDGWLAIEFLSAQSCEGA